MKNAIKNVMQTLKDLRSESLLQEEMKQIIGGYDYTNGGQWTTTASNTYIGANGDCRRVCDVAGGANVTCGVDDQTVSWGAWC